MRDEALILALDIGSSSARAVLYDGRGRAVPGMAAQEQYALRAAPDGTAEDDPDAAVERAARCVDAVLARAGALAGRIAAVAVDTMVSTFVALDGAGRPLTPLITYADTRNGEDAEALRRELDEGAVHDRTGCLLRTSYWPARLAWLRRERPALWGAAARFATLGEYLELRLFGRGRVSYSVAAWTGLLDRRRLVWDAPLLAHLGADVEQLAPLVDVDEPLVGLAAPYAARWPALSGVPWFPAVGDGAAANLGSGCTGHSRIALTMGTTGAMRVVQADLDTVPPGLWCYRVDKGLALVGGATSEGGNVYAWLRQTLRLGEPAAVEAALAAFPPDGHGLTILPFVAGERSPDWAGNVQATIHGLTLASTPIGILRASLEAVAYRFAVIERRLCGRVGCDHCLVASGSGLLRSPAWVRIFADVLGRPVVASAEPEATSRGAALLALRSLGALGSLEAAGAADGPVCEPDPARHAIYREAIERQGWLYERLIARGPTPPAAPALRRT
ncbi:MAG TPA: gluconokinase [Chloroflexaceae bacterium]|nr:gluconokinase [Chloroflexaceae bacterium]